MSESAEKPRDKSVEKPSPIREQWNKLKKGIQEKGKEWKPTLDKAKEGAKKIGKATKEAAQETWKEAKPTVDRNLKKAKARSEKMLERGRKYWEERFKKKESKPER